MLITIYILPFNFVAIFNILEDNDFYWNMEI